MYSITHLITKQIYNMTRKKSIFGAQNVDSSLMRTASKTVRKFTTIFGEESLPTSVSVNLDWLAFMVECALPEPEPNQGPVWLNDDFVLEYKMKGTPIFNYSYVLYSDGEPVANLHTHGKNPVIIKPGTAKLEMMNHVLYSSTVMQTLEAIMIACKMSAIKNISRMDISIDNCEHIWKFANNFVSQKNNGKIPQLKTLGRWDTNNRVVLNGKASWDSKRFSRADGLYHNFKIGGGRKCLVIYNKTSELERSHKEYIREAWDKAGIDHEGRNIWRCELRLTSQEIKNIKDFDFEKIIDPNYLLQIFKTKCENFFQFVLCENDTNITRGRIIDLFFFEKLRIPLLHKIPRAIVRGAYKAQMSIHNAYANIRLGLHKTFDSINAALQHITDNVHLYNLDRWYERKKPQWDNMYLVHAYAPEPYREMIN
jgi:hypothetical protein